MANFAITFGLVVAAFAALITAIVATTYAALRIWNWLSPTSPPPEQRGFEVVLPETQNRL